MRAITNDDFRRVAASLDGKPFIPERETRCGFYGPDGPCPESPVETLVPVYGDGFDPVPVCAAHLTLWQEEHLLTAQAYIPSS